jgi:hypothetical protein
VYDFGSDFRTCAPASAAAIRDIEKQCPTKLPDSYRDFLSTSNGGEGFIGIGGYVVLWSAEAVLDQRSKYEFEVYLPEFLPIGSNGGGECLVICFMGQNPVFGFIPFIGMSETSFHPFGRSLWEALDRIGEDTPFDGM